MLLDIVIITLRETLEASILIGILLAVSRNVSIGFSWLLFALPTGAMGACLYAVNLGFISEIFDYTGQELINAAMQYTLYCLLVLIIAIQFFISPCSKYKLRILMALAVAIAISREGSELFVFYSGLLHAGDSLLRALTSGFIGLAVGMSAGAIAYYSLVSQTKPRAIILPAIALTLVAGGMVIQATQLLIQADWLTASQPLWDSNGILPETSVLGQVVYAVFGYEATPSKVEIIAYFFSILVIIGAVFMAARIQPINPLLVTRD